MTTKRKYLIPLRIQTVFYASTTKINNVRTKTRLCITVRKVKTSFVRKPFASNVFGNKKNIYIYAKQIPCIFSVFKNVRYSNEIPFSVTGCGRAILTLGRMDHPFFNIQIKNLYGQFKEMFFFRNASIIHRRLLAMRTNSVRYRCREKNVYLIAGAGCYEEAVSTTVQ